MSPPTHVATYSDSTPGVTLDDLLDQLTIPDYVNTYGEYTWFLLRMCRVHVRVCLSEMEVPMPHTTRKSNMASVHIVSKTTPVSFSILGLCTFHFSQKNVVAAGKGLFVGKHVPSRSTHPYLLTGETNVRRQGQHGC